MITPPPAYTPKHMLMLSLNSEITQPPIKGNFYKDRKGGINIFIRKVMIFEKFELFTNKPIFIITHKYQPRDPSVVQNHEVNIQKDSDKDVYIYTRNKIIYTFVAHVTVSRGSGTPRRRTELRITRYIRVL